MSKRNMLQWVNIVDKTYKLYFFNLGLATLTINCIVLREILRILPSLLVPTFNPSVLVSRLVCISENKMRIVTPKLQGVPKKVGLRILNRFDSYGLKEH